MSTTQTRSNELVEMEVEEEEEEKLIVPIRSKIPQYYETMNQLYDLELLAYRYLDGIKGIVVIISSYLNESHMLQEVAGKQLFQDIPWIRLWWLNRSYFRTPNVFPFKLLRSSMIDGLIKELDQEDPMCGIVQIISSYLNETHMLQQVAGKQLFIYSAWWNNWWIHEFNWLEEAFDELAFLFSTAFEQHEPIYVTDSDDD